jgi:hypothetical protein
MVTAAEIHRMINMRHLVVLPFVPQHVDQIGLSSDDQHMFASIPDIQNRLEHVSKAKTAWTIFYRGKPALVMGLEYKWDTNYEAWLVPGELSIEHGALLTRGARRFFDKIGAKLGLLRMQIVVCVDREKAVQWARFLKFEREGLMRRYGPEGKDYYMYARTY